MQGKIIYFYAYLLISIVQLILWLTVLWQFYQVGESQKRAVRKLSSKKISQKDPMSRLLIVTCGEGRQVFKMKDVMFITINKGRSLVVTMTGTYQVTERFYHLEGRLSNEFIKVHRQYIINSQEIKYIQPWFNQKLQLTLTDQSKVPVSRSYIKSFKEQIGI